MATGKLGLAPSNHFSGWRRVALFNATALAVVSILFVGFLIAAVTHTGGLRRPLIFFTGDCSAADRMDTGLHLLLNAFSTGIIASSNFFMQVLNAPSRQELDAAHSKGAFLHIGVASLRNAFGVARWKACVWLVLALSSVPIHLLFNSAIFATDWRDAGYHLTIATDGFANGGQFFVPGASLSPAGMSPVFADTSAYLNNRRYGSGYGSNTGMTGGCPNCSSVSFPGYAPDELGWANITHDATRAAGWVKLDRKTCAKAYATECRGVREYRNLMLAVDRQSAGWARNDVWDFDERTSKMWDTLVPGDQDNSLWYAAWCTMMAEPAASMRTVCQNSCADILSSNGRIKDFESEWAIQFFPDGVDFRGDSPSPWPWASGTNGSVLGIRPGAGVLRVEYCLAETVPAQGCSVGLSNLLLFAVMVCVCVKAIACAGLLFAIRHETPIATLEDAIASFIVTPQTGPVQDAEPVANTVKGGTVYHRVDSRGAVQWRNTVKRAHKSIPWHGWTMFSIPLVLGIAFAGFLIWGGTNDLFRSFDALVNLFNSENHDSDYGGNGAASSVEMILAFNSPQLFLTLWYLIYNQLLTQICMVEEWEGFSNKFLPLRVTTPRGKQVSTHFLQLPYFYSIPLITSSVILHWLLSRSFYVFIGQGDYVTTKLKRQANFRVPDISDPSLPENSLLVMSLRV
ncbi:hypothetical protein OQA88_604 [Cercophora sp. LCS_1]